MFRSYLHPPRILMRGILPALLLLVTGACSSIEYVNNDTLKEMGLNKDEAGRELTGGYFPKQLGAIAVGGKKDSYEEGGIIFIRRDGKDYKAETVLFDNAGKTDPTFDKTYLTFGSDKSNDGFRMELRLTF